MNDESSEDRLEIIARLEREKCNVRRHRLRITEKYDREEQLQTVQRVIKLEYELRQARCDNVQLKQSLDEVEKHSKKQLCKIADLERRVKRAERELWVTTDFPRKRDAKLQPTNLADDPTEAQSKIFELLYELR